MPDNSGMDMQSWRERLFSTIEVIKDLSLWRARNVAVLIAVGHPLFFFIWTAVYPQPYESFLPRLAASCCGIIFLALSFKLDINSALLEAAYGITSFLGTVMVGTWFFVANSANSVWLATYCLLILIYCSVTDFRVALAGTAIAALITRITFPLVEPAIWAQESADVFTGPVLVVVLFTVIVATVIHVNDLNVRGMMQISQRRALGTAAHEVRTPLAGISLQSDALQEAVSSIEAGKSIDKETASFITDLAVNISNSVKTVQRIVTTQLANSDPRTAFSHRAPVDIVQLATDSIHDFQLGDTSRNSAVRLTVLNEYSISGDRVVMQQVLINLLENALTAVVLKSRKPYPGCIELIISANASSNLLIVKDKGIGIPRLEQSRIFKPFYTRLGEQGHGLGLTFVKAAITAYNGTIEVTSLVNDGCTFTIKFPK